MRHTILPSSILMEAFTKAFTTVAGTDPTEPAETADDIQRQRARQLLSSEAGQAVLIEVALSAQISFMAGFINSLEPDPNKFLLNTDIIKVFQEQSEKMEGELAGVYVDFLR